MKRPILLVALLIAVVSGVAWIVSGGPREPVYNGKVLTYWLEHYFPTRTNLMIGFVTSDPQAVEAIRQIGTNGIPTLLRLTRALDSPFKLKLLALARKQHLIQIEAPQGGMVVFASGATVQQKHLLRIRLTPAPYQNEWAKLGFWELRSAASNAVPALVEIFDANLSDSSQLAAGEALGAIGPGASQAVPSLVRTLAGTNTVMRATCIRALGMIHAEPRLALSALTNCLSGPNLAAAAEALGQFGASAGPAVPALVEIFNRSGADSSRAATSLGLIGPAAKAAVPSLLRGLHASRDMEFRLQCILALGRIHAEPELVVTPLMECIRETFSDSDVRVRLFSAEALGQYGTSAKPAVPVLTSLLQDRNPNVRREATNALKLIDPAAAFQAGIE